MNVKSYLAVVVGLLLALCATGPMRLAAAQGGSPASPEVMLTPPGSQTPRVIQGGDAYPHVELVTMGVGSLIWERHGHIALCIQWSPERDVCYNYGVANFADPVGMGFSFFRGEPSFWVGATLESLCIRSTSAPIEPSGFNESR